MKDILNIAANLKEPTPEKVVFSIVCIPCDIVLGTFSKPFEEVNREVAALVGKHIAEFSAKEHEFEFQEPENT
jgi:hypothetical protein